jgi:hypothetical protein
MDGNEDVARIYFPARDADDGFDRTRIALCRTLHVERLVGPLVVVAVDEVIEPGLRRRSYFHIASLRCFATV